MELFNVTKMTQQPTYDAVSVQPMRDELTAVGCKELLTPEDVDKALGRQDDKTVFVVLNSVCGCSAGSARPAVMVALQNGIIPDELYTLFGGMEKDAVDLYRSKYLPNYIPSSPGIALFRNGEPVAIFQRSDIEKHTADSISKELVSIFNQECNNTGPSISAKDFENVTKGKYGCYTDRSKVKE
ncbi:MULTISPECIES: BrxA/BrxB family bacilliredoxin [unclassified Mucilaginibacter]|uniref:BrxA/BrxB family bacilliredoxin n=1 Tax=unclassified Mucilaginibacter TaxID=2617802 RepID=UPI002AC90AC1|nr:MULTISPECIES: BrxA/BrxB family bacilliredoxin [unclassified Mucilaginibacter]WPX22405.1 BrxA/BrxB family bacilliredoxin [Mucilaginibacter sp. 5C4]